MSGRGYAFAGGAVCVMAGLGVIGYLVGDSDAPTPKGAYATKALSRLGRREGDSPCLLEGNQTTCKLK